MNYSKIYDALICKAKNRQDKVIYGEVHHIIPRCLGGNGSKDNLVLLTYREHFIAHLLLVKMYPNNTRLYFAFNCFSAKQRTVPFHNVSRELPKFSGRMFEKMKQEAKNRMLIDKEWRRNCSLHAIDTIWINNGEKNKRVKKDQIQFYLNKGWMRGRTYHKRKNNPEMYKKISTLLKGRKVEEEQIRKVKEWQKAHPRCWISKNKESKQIYLEELENCLKEGWTRGRNDLRSDDSDCVYVKCKNLVRKISKMDEFLYLENGWLKCNKEDYVRNSRNTYSFMCWMTNGKRNVRVSVHEISIFRSKGYREGRLYSRKEKSC